MSPSAQLDRGDPYIQTRKPFSQCGQNELMSDVRRDIQAAAQRQAEMGCE